MTIPRSQSNRLKAVDQGTGRETEAPPLKSLSSSRKAACVKAMCDFLRYDQASFSHHCPLLVAPFRVERRCGSRGRRPLSAEYPSFSSVYCGGSPSSRRTFKCRRMGSPKNALRPMWSSRA